MLHKTLQIQQIRPDAAKVIVFYFWGISFGINFLYPRNPIFCNTYNAKSSFFIISGLPFWHNKSINQSCFFQPASLTSFVQSYFFSVCFKQSRFWDTFKIQWAPKWVQQSTSFAKLSKSCMRLFWCGVVFRELLFLQP